MIRVQFASLVSAWKSIQSDIIMTEIFERDIPH